MGWVGGSFLAGGSVNMLALRVFRSNWADRFLHNEESDEKCERNRGVVQAAEFVDTNNV